MAEPGIPLADLIDAVRAELETAVLNAREQQLQFEIQDVELDVEVTTTGTREASGGVKIWVLAIGAKDINSNVAAKKVKIKLGAITTDGKKYKVSDETSRQIRRK